MKHWLAEWLGIGSVTNTSYSFWSGFGGCIRDIGALLIIATHLRWHRRRMDDT